MAVTWIDPVEITPADTGRFIDVDLSTNIASGATGVLLHIVCTGSTDYGFFCRKNGSTDDRTADIKAGYHQWGACGVDINRILEIYIANAAIDVYLVGYFTSDAVFLTNATDISISTTGTWTDIDIGVNDGAIGAVVELYNTSGAAYYEFGIRKNGSTDEHYDKAYRHAWAIVGLDSNEVFEGKIANTVSDFYLQGYIKTNATFNTNATDLSITTTGAYTDLAALPSGATGGLIEVQCGTTYRKYALRKNGSSEDLYYYLRYHGWAFVECDSNRIIEGEINNTSMDFFLTGYTTAGTSAQTISLTGIASAPTIGTITMTPGAVALALSGIASTSTIGTPTLVTSGTPQTLSLDGIASASVIGSPTMVPGVVTLSLNGISSGVTLGAITLSPGAVTLAVTGISSEATIGAPTFVPGAVALSVNGIAPTASIGEITLVPGAVALSVTGIESTVTIGTVAIIQGATALELSGISSTATIGSITLVPGTATITPLGIASGATIGNITLLPGAVTVSLPGIASTAVIGNPTIMPGVVTLSVSGIASASTIGSISLLPGAVTLALSGIASTVQIGTPTMLTGILVLEGITSTSEIGIPTLVPGAVTLFLTGISNVEIRTVFVTMI